MKVQMIATIVSEFVLKWWDDMLPLANGVIRHIFFNETIKNYDSSK